MNSRTITRSVPALLAAVSLIGSQAAWAARGEITIPADTVVKLKLDTHLSSKTARRGDRFAAVLDGEDRTGFPEGTRFQGVVTDVQRFSKDRPGMLDVDFRTAYLPDGQKASINGRLASLADDDVRRSEDGRLESRKSGGKKPDWKWAGYGAAGGAVLSGILGGGVMRGILLGGVGGAAYAYLNKKGGKGKARDVDLPRGTEFGMELTQRVAFQDRDNYRYYEQTAGYRDSSRRSDGQRTDERLGDRVGSRVGDRTSRGGESALVNGKAVRFDTARPHKVNGVAFFPLSQIAEAANLRLDWRRGDRDFSLTSGSLRFDGRVGDRDVTRDGKQLFSLQDAPMLENDELLVPRDFLREVGMTVRYSDTDNRWEIDTTR